VTSRTVAIALKIPDNAAYTALTALRRLGLNVERVERREIWEFDDDGDPGTLSTRVSANATLFNPNKHRLEVLDRAGPSAGETWISPADRHDEIREHLGGTGIAGVTRAVRSVGWRLTSAGDAPAGHETLVRAVEGLLCNPAIETARYGE
jgi:phosphoribosylformylglycinamidine (FGAM) synthase PurS component